MPSRRASISLRFGDSPEEQAEAHEIVSAMRDGYLDRKNGVPLHHDEDGTPVYRILLGGLPWRKTGDRQYEAQDGAERTWRVQSGRRGWSASLLGTEPIDILPTMRAARVRCEERARRMRWREGAPW